MARPHVWLAAAMLALASCGPSAPIDTPVAQRGERPALKLAGYVTDAADVLTPAEEARLTALLERFQRETKHQMVVVSVPSLGGDSIAAFTLRLANDWGIGDRDQDDGVVLLVAPNQRQARIEVGLGLESRLTNAECDRIMGEHMIPEMRQGAYAAGFEKAADEIWVLVRTDAGVEGSAR